MIGDEVLVSLNEVLMEVGTKKALAIAGGFAGSYFALVELILLWPLGSGATITMLSAADTIALASGVLTAAGLSALWLQLVAASQATREVVRLEADRAAAAALRFDELHMEFNSQEFRVMRDLGWHYLKYVVQDEERLKSFANWWVCSEGAAPSPPDNLLNDANLGHLGEKHLSDYTWAISVMVAFFVRIENRLNAHYGSASIDPEVLRVAVGPFFWKYWETDLLKLIKACDESFASWPSDKKEQPYFSAALKNLKSRFPSD
ncbi:hypothetical protein [Novosphingobium sp. CECT 9465]|uniref:hypothetical protein n=1 Tax=Novosphingobium sp. CECT 9465 TaxID=2829794 RepID=UPI001E305633|nr:hypothetical protein [Novosphingobium sp. CECT 9465]CAH0496551.1 hypothetical protein NVSP9465_01587 [Novosphingobium sp. CECT 9465]